MATLARVWCDALALVVTLLRAERNGAVVPGPPFFACTRIWQGAVAIVTADLMAHGVLAVRTRPPRPALAFARCHAGAVVIAPAEDRVHAFTAAHAPSPKRTHTFVRVADPWAIPAVRFVSVRERVRERGGHASRRGQNHVREHVREHDPEYDQA